MDKDDSGSLLEISESDRQTNLLLSNNLTDIFCSDYYSRFKNSTNINEPSMTMSRVSQLDKISEDNSNTTHIKIIHITERLTSEIQRNQLLENKISAQDIRIKELQDQLQAKEFQLKDTLHLNLKLQTQINKEQDKIRQYIKQNKELKFIINSLQNPSNISDLRTETLQSTLECPSVRPISQTRGKRAQNNSHSYSSSKAVFTKMLTEDSQQNLSEKIKEALSFLNQRVENQKRDQKINDKSKYYRSQSNFWSSVTTSPNPGRSNHTQNNISLTKLQSTDKKLDNTLILLKSIRQQCNQITTQKKG
ncbi:unnamed protein product [Paramecium primaurelia]|uniref:Uncharacterized protein n=1 Tax=Paramecium primaurelia TaxID=5886 RepID=A0A8S1L752_PARPR|nr:unnamed protein product [Paramecium primaurelia]